MTASNLVESLKQKPSKSRMSDDALKILAAARARSQSRRRTGNDLASELVDSLNQAFGAGSSREALRLKQSNRSQRLSDRGSQPAAMYPVEPPTKRRKRSHSVAASTQSSQATLYDLVRSYAPKPAPVTHHSKDPDTSSVKSGRIQRRSSMSLWLHAPLPGVDERGRRLQLGHRYYVGALPPAAHAPPTLARAINVAYASTKKHKEPISSHAEQSATLETSSRGNTCSSPRRVHAMNATPARPTDTLLYGQTQSASKETGPIFSIGSSRVGPSVDARKRVLKASDGAISAPDVAASPREASRRSTSGSQGQPVSQAVTVSRQTLSFGTPPGPVVDARTNVIAVSDSRVSHLSTEASLRKVKTHRGQRPNPHPSAQIADNTARGQPIPSSGAARADGVTGTPLSLGIGPRHLHLTDSLFRVGSPGEAFHAKSQGDARIIRQSSVAVSKTAPSAGIATKMPPATPVIHATDVGQPSALLSRSMVNSGGEPAKRRRGRSRKGSASSRPREESSDSGDRPESVPLRPRKQSVAPGPRKQSVAPGPRKTNQVDDLSVSSRVEALNNTFSSSSLGKRKAADPTSATGWYLDPETLVWKWHLPTSGGSHDPPSRAVSTPLMESQPAPARKTSVRPKFKMSAQTKPSTDVGSTKGDTVRTPGAHRVTGRYTDISLPLRNFSPETQRNGVSSARAESRSRARVQSGTPSVSTGDEIEGRSQSRSRSRSKKQEKVQPARNGDGTHAIPVARGPAAKAHVSGDQEPRKRGRPRKSQSSSQPSTRRHSPAEGPSARTDQQDERQVEDVPFQGPTGAQQSHAHTIASKSVHDIAAAGISIGAASLGSKAVIEYQRREYLCAALVEAMRNASSSAGPIFLRFAGCFSELVDPAKDVVPYTGEVAADVVNRTGLTLWCVQVSFVFPAHTHLNFRFPGITLSSVHLGIHSTITLYHSGALVRRRPRPPVAVLCSLPSTR